MNLISIYNRTVEAILAKPEYIEVFREIETAAANGEWSATYDLSKNSKLSVDDIDFTNLEKGRKTIEYARYGLTVPVYWPWSVTPKMVKSLEILGFDVELIASISSRESEKEEEVTNRSFFGKETVTKKKTTERFEYVYGIKISWERKLEEVLEYQKSIPYQVTSKNTSNGDSGIGLGTAIVGGSMLGLF